MSDSLVITAPPSLRTAGEKARTCRRHVYVDPLLFAPEEGADGTRGPPPSILCCSIFQSLTSLIPKSFLSHILTFSPKHSSWPPNRKKEEQEERGSLRRDLSQRDTDGRGIMPRRGGGEIADVAIRKTSRQGVRNQQIRLWMELFSSWKVFSLKSKSSHHLQNTFPTVLLYFGVVKNILVF